MTNDEKQIRELVEAKAAALPARDLDGMVHAYAEQVVVYNLAPPLRQSSDARDTAAVGKWVATFTGPIEYEVRDLDVTVGGDVAFCSSINRLTAVPAGTDEPFTLWHRVTLGLRRIGGTWRITHEHESVPFEMDDTMRASVNLQP